MSIPLLPLARTFNSYYTASDDAGATRYPILQCPDPAMRDARICIIQMIAISLETGLQLLGIQTLETM